jgi:NADPH:quinone reductase
MVQTAHGSLTVGLDAQPGQTLLIRGGTSSVGMAAATLAKDRGLTILSTTRQPDRVAALKAIGVDHVLLDDGNVAAQARAIVPEGVGRSPRTRRAGVRSRATATVWAFEHSLVRAV